MDHPPHDFRPPVHDWVWLDAAARALEMTEEAILLGAFRQELRIGVDAVSVMNRRCAPSPNVKLAAVPTHDHQIPPGASGLYGVELSAWHALVNAEDVAVDTLIQYQEDGRREFVTITPPVSIRRTDIGMAHAEVERLRALAGGARPLSSAPEAPKREKANYRQDRMLREAIRECFPQGLPPPPPLGHKDPSKEKVFERSEFVGWSPSMRKKVWARRDR